MTAKTHSHTHITETQIDTTCAYCGVGCGVSVNKKTTRLHSSTGNLHKQSETLTSLHGDANHPANAGKLCVKGSHLLDTNALSGRLLKPTIEGQQTTWDDALDTIASSMKRVIAEHGPDAVAFYLSGQLLTEDYYVANKFLKGFVGTANVDTNSRLCMSSAVAAYKRAFGADAVPCCYDDLAQSDLIVLIGSNAAWTHPVLYQKMQAAKAQRPNMKMVLIDPRGTATQSGCDLHLPLKAGTDAWLFNGLLHFMHANQMLDVNFIAQHTQDFEACIASAGEANLQDVARICEVNENDLLCFYQWFASSSSAISFYSMGINQSSTGVDKANSIINCHLASGKIGKPGSGPFSITGQPNAMGGREVGGLANMLAAHMDIDNPKHRDTVARFWQAPNLASKAGLKAVDMFDALDKGRIKFIWIMGTNPVVSMPNRNLVERALRNCPHVVVSDVVDKNDTLTFANIALPATPWSEKNGTVTNSERCISRQRALLSPAGEAKHDWQAICEVAKRMGFTSAFNFKHASDIFSEHAKLSGFENKGERAFNIGGLADLDTSAYDALRPVQWPLKAKGDSSTKRLFTDATFYTASGRANFIPIVPSTPQQKTSIKYPLVLNTGRMRDHWHTMTRTGKAAKLHQHTEQAYVYIHPSDANTLGASEPSLIALHSELNRDTPCILPLKITPEQRKGELFCPIHWSKQYSSHVNIAALFSSANDAISGQPELKHAAVKASLIHTRMNMNLYTRHALDEKSLFAIADYFVVLPLSTGFVYRLALFETNSGEQSQHRLSQTVTLSKWLKLIDSTVKTHQVRQSLHAYASDSGSRASNTTNNIENYRAVSSKTGSEQCVSSLGDTLFYFASASMHSKPAQGDWLAYLFSQTQLAPQHIHFLLRNQVEQAFTQGKQVCSCFKVHEKPIIDAIKQGSDTVDALGKTLKCGSNCGSCKSELQQMINLVQQDIPATTPSEATYKTAEQASIPIKVEI